MARREPLVFVGATPRADGVGDGPCRFLSTQRRNFVDKLKELAQQQKHVAHVISGAATSAER
eukprot:9162453-Alexandrium_andersonii.AAC.1